ncbi:MAG: hypothetical protein WC346_18260 [Methanogenium sp.]|jgi:hypothetical protein
MRKLIVIVLAMSLMLTGCMTANMLEAEKAYYEATVKMQQAQAAQPIFEMAPAKKGEPIVLGNVGSFKVYGPVAGNAKELIQYKQTDYVGPWLRFFGGLAPYAGIWGVAHEFGKAAGDTITNYTQTTSGGSTSSIKTSSMATGNMGDGNTLSGMTEISDSYNPSTTTTTTSTDDHSSQVDDHSTPTE